MFVVVFGEEGVKGATNTQGADHERYIMVVVVHAEDCN